jgi:serine/threonine protein kinase
MAGLRWSYEQLVQYFDQSPYKPGDLNPLIKQMLMTCPGSSIFSIGGHAVILWVSPSIVAKVSLKPGDERLRHEQEILELLDRSECSQIIRSLFRGDGVSFLELIANGTLRDRMSLDKPRPISQWMLQLSSAVACLEALGYAHGDINPQNILLDAYDEVKLIDFDHSPKIGDALDVGYEPYVRQHRETIGGLYGIAGPVTEQFALGSVFWYMIRGSELYAELEGPDQVDRLLDGKFPTTDAQIPTDKIIGNCWRGYYLRIAELVDDIRNSIGVEIQKRDPISLHEKSERRSLCEHYYSLISLSKTEEGIQN